MYDIRRGEGPAPAAGAELESCRVWPHPHSSARAATRSVQAVGVFFFFEEESLFITNQN